MDTLFFTYRKSTLIGMITVCNKTFRTVKDFGKFKKDQLMVSYAIPMVSYIFLFKDAAHSFCPPHFMLSLKNGVNLFLKKSNLITLITFMWPSMLAF